MGLDFPVGGVAISSHMFKWLVALSLVLTLISPHAIGSNGLSDASVHSQAMKHHAGLEQSDHAGHHGDKADASKECCHAVVGACVGGFFAPHHAVPKRGLSASDNRVALADDIPTQHQLSFEPPPPRV